MRVGDHQTEAATLAEGKSRTVRIPFWPVALVVVGISLSACGSANLPDQAGSTIDPKYGVSPSPRVVAEGQPVPRGGGYNKIGKPYVVAGRTYVPREDPNYVQEGSASWYGKDFHGRKTANGEIFDMNSVSAAHTTLPLPSYVRVTNLANNNSIIVRVNNRGPFHGDRIIDLSYRTAQLLGFADKGLARVRLEYVGRAPLGGADDKILVASLSKDGTPAQLPGRSAVMVADAKPLVPDVPQAMPTSAPTPPPRPEEISAGGHAPALALAPQQNPEAGPLTTGGRGGLSAAASAEATPEAGAGEAEDAPETAAVAR